MMADLARHARSVEAVLGRDHLNPTVIAAIEAVPRSAFVAECDQALAFGDHPIAIGHGQTISQPFVVAFMTDVLGVERHHKVLEIGTGSGYQAAVLAQLAAMLHSVEIIEALADQAAANLASFGYANLMLHKGDGRQGLAHEAPFDRIMATAATDRVPPAWLDQLAPRGRLLAPIGRYRDFQELMLFEKSETGEISERATLAVAFVPLTGTSD